MIRAAQSRIYDTVTLYRVVYLSRFVFCAVFVLLLSFFLQPIDRAFASELPAAEPAPEVSEASEEPTEEAAKPAEPEVVEEEVSEVAEEPEEADETNSAIEEAPEVEQAEVTVDEATASETEDIETVDGSEVAEPVGSEEVPQDGETESGEVSSGEEVSEEEAASSTSSVTAVDDTGVNPEDVASTTDSEVSDVTATSSEAEVQTEAEVETESTAGGSGGGGGAEPESDIGEVEVVATSTEATATSSDEAADDALTNDGETTETPVVSEETESEQVAAPEPADSDEVSDSSENVAENNEETATSSQESVEVVVEETYESTNDENRHQFSVDECVSVGDGSYYCSKKESDTSAVGSGVYAEADADGDREIFYKVGDEVLKVTDNQYDDDAPHVDGMRHEIVWHRLVEGRYQIMHYDLVDEVETQLTATRDSNMEPAVAEGAIVWQRWVNDNWEIILYQNGEETQLTDNTHHDVAPTIRDGYVMWHTTSSQGDKQLVVHELESGLTSNISDPDGGHVENPRFVLVYDTVLDNGDTITKEYDPETGSIKPISSEPAPLPTHIPDPEPVEEAKALVGVKVNGKEDTLDISADTSLDTDGESDIDKIEEGDVLVGIDDSVASSTVAVEEVEVIEVDMSDEEEVLELTEFDLVVEPFVATSSAQQSGTGTTTDSVE